MGWLISAYVFMSVVISISAGFHAGLAAGFCAIATSTLAPIAGGGLKAMLFWGSTLQKIAGPIVAMLLAALAYWLSGGFSVGLFDYLLTGAEWGVIGFVIAFLWADRRIAAKVLN